MTAYLIVRAEVLDAAVKEEFDRWYRDEHLLDAHKAFKAKRAFRAWSEGDPCVHYAFYEFDDVSSARAAVASDELKRLAAEFDRAWGNKTKRSREVVEAVQTIHP